MSAERTLLDIRSLLRPLLFVLLVLALSLLSSPITRAQSNDSGAPLTGAVDVAVGDDFACALLEEGTVWCWGRNADGQLGDGTAQESLVPVQVLGIDNAVKITAGSRHACALRDSGGVACWGNNNSGEVGIPQPEALANPVEVPGIADAIDLASTAWQNCALMRNGTVNCWSRGTYSEQNYHWVLGNYSGGTAITTGENGGCILMQDRSVDCWIWRYFTPPPGGGPPLPKMAIINDVARVASAVDMDYARMCAVVEGTINCWDADWHVAEDQNDLQGRFTPVAVISDLEGVLEIDVTGGLCARTADGIYCQSRRSTHNMNLADDALVRVTGVEAPVSFGNGAVSTCTIDNKHGDHRVLCWGQNGAGQLGVGATSSVETPVMVEGTEGATAVALGFGQTCALFDGGDLRCWGGAPYPSWQGENLDPSYVAVPQANLAGATAIGSDVYGICAALRDGSIDCPWKPATSISGDESRVEQRLVLTEVVDSAVGSEHLCALTEREILYCWGNGQYGATGLGNQDSTEYPVAVPGMTDVVDVDASAFATCAVKRDTSLWCWGWSWQVKGMLDGDLTAFPINSPVIRFTEGVRKVSMGPNSACVALGERGAQCWGQSENGLLGVGEKKSQMLEPTQVEGLSQVDDVAVGADQACFLSSGEVWCTGAYLRRHVVWDGSYRTAYYSIPAKINLPGRALDIATGPMHACAVVIVGNTTQVACWGWNDQGQVGANPGWEPVEVRSGN